MTEVSSSANTGGGLHFTVGSLRQTSRSRGGIDFRGELGLLKAALLYADQVEMVSVGASFMETLDDLGKMSKLDRLAFMRDRMPTIDSDASSTELEEIYRSIDSIREKLARNRRLTPTEVRKLWSFDEEWRKIQGLVEAQFEEWGAKDFRVALDSGRLRLRPFRATSFEALLRLGMSEDNSSTESFADDAYEEYRQTVVEAVGDSKTYPLFDDLTGNVVKEAVRKGLISPTSAAHQRSRHGGLTGDVLQRLPMFERADADEILDIRGELSPYLSGFREAVGEWAQAISSASWEGEEFAEEADLIYRERVVQAVNRIDEAARDNRDLKERCLRYGPFAIAGGASSLNAFIGSGSALYGLVGLAANLVAAGGHGAAVARNERKKLEGDRVYFYYRAARSLTRRRK